MEERYTSQSLTWESPASRLFSCEYTLRLLLFDLHITCELKCMYYIYIYRTFLIIHFLICVPLYYIYWETVIWPCIIWKVFVVYWIYWRNKISIFVILLIDEELRLSLPLGNEQVPHLCDKINLILKVEQRRESSLTSKADLWRCSFKGIKLKDYWIYWTLHY